MENMYNNFLRVWKIPISQNILHSSWFDHIFVECIHLTMKIEKQAASMLFFFLFSIFNEGIKHVTKR